MKFAINKWNGTYFSDSTWKGLFTCNYWKSNDANAYWKCPPLPMSLIHVVGNGLNKHRWRITTNIRYILCVNLKAHLCCYLHNDLKSVCLCLGRLCSWQCFFNITFNKCDILSQLSLEHFANCKHIMPCSHLRPWWNKFENSRIKYNGSPSAIKQIQLVSKISQGR